MPVYLLKLHWKPIICHDILEFILPRLLPSVTFVYICALR